MCITERPSLRLTPRTWNDQVTELNRAIDTSFIGLWFFDGGSR